MRLFPLAALVVAFLIGTPESAAAWTPSRGQLQERRVHVMDMRHDRCLHTWRLRPLPGMSRDGLTSPIDPPLTSAQLRWKWGWWGHLKERTREKGSKCITSPADIIRAVFPDSTENAAIAVATCESGLYIYAHNPSGASGLFQLMPFWWQGKFDPYNPWANTRAAYSISHAGTSWAAWVCQP